MIKPKIGIALGSGGARGWAHIGVLQALAERGVRPDIVCGSSMGALIGAAYVAGRLETLDLWARRLTRRRMLGLIDVRLARGGLIEGGRIVKFVKGLLPDQPIETLETPYLAVASELSSGREVWIQDGLLSEAIRASIAMPGVFSPTERDGAWLVDGGLTNPVPVSACRALGADIIIAVNPNSKLRRQPAPLSRAKAARADDLIDEASRGARIANGLRSMAPLRLGAGLAGMAHVLLRRKSNAPSYLEVISTSIDVMSDLIRSSRLAGEPPHIMLQPQLSHRSVLEFYRAEEAIAEGRESVAREAATLSAYFGDG